MSFQNPKIAAMLTITAADAIVIALIADLFSPAYTAKVILTLSIWSPRVISILYSTSEESASVGVGIGVTIVLVMVM